MGSCTFRIGDHHIGVRVSSEDFGEWLRAALAAHLVDDDQAPPNYSVRVDSVTANAVNKQPFHFLFDGGLTAVRTRSPRRVVTGLLHYLGHHAHEDGDDVLAVEARAFVRGKQAVLVPLLAGLETLERPLNGAGFAVLDVPHPQIDLITGELLVRHPSIAIDDEAFAQLTRIKPEPRRPDPVVEAGRYQITGWIFPGPDDPSLSKAEAVAHAVTLLRGGGTSDIGRALSALADLFSSVRPVRLAVFTKQAVLATIGVLAPQHRVSS